MKPSRHLAESSNQSTQTQLYWIAGIGPLLVAPTGLNAQRVVVNAWVINKIMKPVINRINLKTYRAMQLYSVSICTLVTLQAAHRCRLEVISGRGSQRSSFQACTANTATATESSTASSQFSSKEKKGKDHTFRRQFNEKPSQFNEQPSIIPGCPCSSFYIIKSTMINNKNRCMP